MAKKEKETKYPELIHIRVDEKTYEILKNQDNYSEFIRQRILNDNKSQEDLDFLKSLFGSGKVTINQEEITEEELAKLDEI